MGGNFLSFLGGYWEFPENLILRILAWISHEFRMQISWKMYSRHTLDIPEDYWKFSRIFYLHHFLKNYRKFQGKKGKPQTLKKLIEIFRVFPKNAWDILRHRSRIKCQNKT